MRVRIGQTWTWTRPTVRCFYASICVKLTDNRPYWLSTQVPLFSPSCEWQRSNLVRLWLRLLFLATPHIFFLSLDPVGEWYSCDSLERRLSHFLVLCLGGICPSNHPIPALAANHTTPHHTTPLHSTPLAVSYSTSRLDNYNPYNEFYRTKWQVHHCKDDNECFWQPRGGDGRWWRGKLPPTNCILLQRWLKRPGEGAISGPTHSPAHGVSTRYWHSLLRLRDGDGPFRGNGLLQLILLHPLCIALWRCLNTTKPEPPHKQYS